MTGFAVPLKSAHRVLHHTCSSRDVFAELIILCSSGLKSLLPSMELTWQREEDGTCTPEAHMSVVAATPNRHSMVLVARAFVRRSVAGGGRHFKILIVHVNKACVAPPCYLYQPSPPSPRPLRPGRGCSGHGWLQQGSPEEQEWSALAPCAAFAHTGRFEK